MAIHAKVLKVMTTDFAEVAILDSATGDPIDDTTYIAQFDGKKEKVRYEDIVEVVPTDNRIMNESRVAYVLPAAGVIVGFLLSYSKGTGQALLSALLLGLMLFIVAWIMNRRSRMLKYRKYKVAKIVKTNPHIL